MQLPFRILEETIKTFPKFNAIGRSLLVEFNSKGEEEEKIVYLRDCVTSLTVYLISEVAGSDLVGIKIRNCDNVQDNLIGLSLRRFDQFKHDVVWDVLG
jgi:hypothetical protein